MGAGTVSENAKQDRRDCDQGELDQGGDNEHQPALRVEGDEHGINLGVQADRYHDRRDHKLNHAQRTYVVASRQYPH